MAPPVAAHYRFVMKIADVVRRKGDSVVTVRSDDDVAAMLALLAEHGIGALVVSDGDRRVDGIVTERDVVRHLHSTGPQILHGPVSAIMTSEVRICSPDASLEELAQTMTQHRIRHLPVVVDDRLTAIVSIGDVVKSRIEALQAERDQLVGYIQQ